EPFDVTNPPKNATASFPWDTRALTNTESYRLGVEVYDAEGKHDVDTVDVVVNNVAPQPPPSPPWLEVTNHTLTRFQNRFIVGLRVKNTGDFEARNAVVRDGMIGFQPMARDAGDAEYLARYHPLGQYGYVEIKLKQNIAAGESRIFFYNVMPVMMHPTPSSPEVGSFVDMAWDSSTQTGYHNYVNQPIGLTTGGETVSKAHANAVKEADYLIVTNPYRLFLTFNPGVDRNKPYCDLLLSTMAELAFEKDGALGYIDTYSAATLRNLITSGGSWSSRMAPGWDSNGYLLLVGENQVVPGWSRYHGKQYTTQGNIPFTASPTDYPYASTSGSELKPELAMGRIIGESPALQIVAIRNSLYSYQGKAGYDYDALQTLAVNGFPACWHGGCDSIDFAHEVNSLPSVLSGTITGMRTPDLAQRDAQGNVVITPTKHAITTTFFTHSADKDIIFLAGHGSGGSWDVFNTGDILAQATPFGSHSPFVFASSCATGDYPGGLSFAESMLARRAAAYLGAVEKGACYTDGTCPHADTFFSNWSSSESFARALKQAKRKIGTSFFDRWWTAIYHLYGDAKFGSLSGLGGMGEGARAASAASAPPDWVPIDVPDYAITETDGADLVEIPGGDQLLVSGQPVVPVYRIFYDFGKEHQVADVRLVHRSEPVALNGLNVPSTTVALAGVGQTGSAEVTPHEPSWWPEQPFEWSVEEGPTTTTLAITVYPFVYDAVTRRGIFFQHYEFEIDHAPSSVAITRLETHQPSYEPGAPVLLELELQNEGSAHDVTVSGVIRRAGTGEVVGGLELRTLKVVEGPAAYTLVWDSAGAAPGSYTTVIDLSGGGVPLDSAQATFELGEGAAEVVGFDAEPAHVDVGEGVNVWLEISNTGAVSITGTLVIQVQGRVGELVAQFQESFAGVPPEGGAVLEAVWETAGVNPADFTLVGYGLFDGKATEPVATTVRVGRRVYLPSVLKTHAG
ncbi:MAG: C25 family cysteine peptidase, partial [Anaerolineae bacterium]